MSKSFLIFREIAFGETAELLKYKEVNTATLINRNRADSEMTARLIENQQDSIRDMDAGGSNPLDKEERSQSIRKGDAYPYFLTLVSMDRSEKFIVKHLNESLKAETLRKVRNIIFKIR